MNLSLMYRGPLTSCNYGCSYCPFSKRQESEARLLHDQQALSRFVHWVRDQSTHQWSILLTPWGEALVRAWYREALVNLSHCDQVLVVAAQTNLSCGLEWFERCRLDRLALWTTFHPTEVSQSTFLSRVVRLNEMGVRLSVGVVAVPGVLEFLPSFRQKLPSEIYLWINAEQPRKKQYTDTEIAQLTDIDPHFPLTLKRSRSLGRWCQAGETSFTVDGVGNMRRCHFVDQPIGNIYEPDWERSLTPRRCPNQFCNCFLGKAQLEPSTLRPAFGESLFTRILPLNP